MSELRNRIHQFLRPLSRREHQAGSTESQGAANPSATASTETNEAVANAQAEPATTMDEGNFISSVLQQIMPFISQNVASSSSGEAATGRGSNSSRQASSREVFCYLHHFFHLLTCYIIVISLEALCNMTLTCGEFRVGVIG